MRESFSWPALRPRTLRPARGAWVPLALAIILPNPAGAQIRGEEYRYDRPDAHGPAGLWADHVLAQGQFEVGYRFDSRDFDGLRKDGEEVAGELVLRDFPFAPVSRRGFQHTLDLRYGVRDGITLQLEVPYRSLESGHLVNGGDPFSTEASGLGDLKISALANVHAKGGARAHVGLGASVPTGAIDQTGATPLALGGTTLPYGMQVGTGTFDLLPSATVFVQNDQGSVGAQLNGRVHVNDNDRGYRFGDRVGGSVWLAPRVNDILSLSFRIHYQNFDGIKGLDPTIDANADPTGDPGAQGGEFVDIPIGLNLYLPDGPFAGHRLSVEMAMPVHQDYNGTQPNRNFQLTVTWRGVF